MSKREHFFSIVQQEIAKLNKMHKKTLLSKNKQVTNLMYFRQFCVCYNDPTEASEFFFWP